jgi:hypothetical protein
MATPREGLAARALRAVFFAIGLFSVPVLASDMSSLAPRAIAWAEQQSARVALSGSKLTPEQAALARSVGVQHPERVRIEVVEQFPLPQQADVKGALRNGVSREEIREVLLQVGIYCGIPAAMDSFRVAREALNEADAAKP